MILPPSLLSSHFQCLSYKLPALGSVSSSPLYHSCSPIVSNTQVDYRPQHTMEYAYNPKDLQANGVIEESCDPGMYNLDNDIHPIWKRDNFRVGDIDEQVRMMKMNDGSWDRNVARIDDNIYRRLEHSLRLATLLLQESGPFFSQLLYGELQALRVRRLHPHGEFGEWRMRSVNVVSNPQYSAPVVAAQLSAFAEDVADTSRIYFSSQEKVRDVWGETQPTLDERCRYAMGIGSILTSVICTPLWHKVSDQTRRFYSFQLALTLVHELAHVAWRCRRWEHLLGNPDDVHEEPILSPSEEQVELGQSWENWFFGGELRPIDAQEDPPRWLGYAYAPFTLDTANQDSLVYRDCRYGGHAVTAQSINQFFQAKPWADHKDGTSPFQIHQTPVSSTTTESADADIDDGFMTRMTLNQEGRAEVRPPFIVEN